MKTNNLAINNYRQKTGKLASKNEDGNNGFFVVPRDSRRSLIVLVSDGMGWDHVSVRAVRRNNSGSMRELLPTWEEMCIVKDLFFEDEETVVQFHPKKSQYVNIKENVLHLWRDQVNGHSLPPKWMV